MDNYQEMMQTYMRRSPKDFLIFEIQQPDEIPYIDLEDDNDPPDAVIRTSDVEGIKKMLGVVALINFASDFEIRHGTDRVKIPRSMTMQDRFRMIYENEDVGFVTKLEECEDEGSVKVSCLHAIPKIRGSKLPEFQIVLHDERTCEESWVNELIEESLSDIVPNNLFCIFDINCDDISRQRTIVTEALIKLCRTVVLEFMTHLRNHVRDDSVLELVSREQIVSSEPCHMFLRPLVEQEVAEKINGDVIDLDDILDDSDLVNEAIMSGTDCKCDQCSRVGNRHCISKPLPKIEHLLLKFWVCNEWLSSYYMDFITEVAHYCVPTVPDSVPRKSTHETMNTSQSYDTFRTEVCINSTASNSSIFQIPRSLSKKEKSTATVKKTSYLNHEPMDTEIIIDSDEEEPLAKLKAKARFFRDPELTVKRKETKFNAMKYKSLNVITTKHPRASKTRAALKNLSDTGSRITDYMPRSNKEPTIDIEKIPKLPVAQRKPRIAEQAPRFAHQVPSLVQSTKLSNNSRNSIMNDESRSGRLLQIALNNLKKQKNEDERKLFTSPQPQPSTSFEETRHSESSTPQISYLNQEVYSKSPELLRHSKDEINFDIMDYDY